MKDFDVSKEWVILAPAAGGATVKAAAGELARRLGELRSGPVPMRSADESAPPEETPIIVLNAGDGGRGYSWRAGEDRVEIYGDSPKGLLDGAFDFLEALGFSWEGDSVRPPLPVEGQGSLGSKRVPLARPGAYAASDAAADRTVAEAAPGESPLALVARAAWSRAEAVRCRGKVNAEARRLAAEYGLLLEAPGPRPGTLLPRLLILIKPDFFRMEGGRRRLDRCFCPSNPAAIAAAARRAARYFRRRPRADVYRFELPRLEEGQALCSCPACRAFSPREQAIMAANAVAAGLEIAAPGARLLVESWDDDDLEPAVRPRNNILIKAGRTGNPEG